MWEINVTDDGTTEIRKVPLAYRDDGTKLLLTSSDAVVSELSGYGLEDPDIEEAMQAAEQNEYRWVEV